MTLATICSNAASMAPVAVPSSFIGNSDQTATLLVALANLAGESIARRPQGGWISQIKEFDFFTQASIVYNGSVANTGPGGVAQITITTAAPDSVLAGLDATWAANGTNLLINTIVSSVSVVGLVYTITCNQAANTSGTGTYNFGKSDYTLPADFRRPIDNTFWDRSRFWSMRGPQSPQQWQIYKSSVIGKASIQRRYRFRQIKGNTVLSIDPVPFDNGKALVFEYVTTGWCQNNLGVAQSQWVNDTDTGIIDEYLIQLSVQWRLLRRLGLSYADEMAESEDEISKALASDGAAPILDLAPGEHLTLIGPWNIPETGYGNVLS